MGRLIAPLFIALSLLLSPPVHAAEGNQHSMAFTLCGTLAGWPDLWKEDRDIDQWYTDSDNLTRNVRQADYDCVQAENAHSPKLAAIHKKRDALLGSVRTLEARTQDIAARIKATVVNVRSERNGGCADQMGRMADVIEARMSLIAREAAGMCEDPGRRRQNPEADEQFD